MTYLRRCLVLVVLLLVTAGHAYAATSLRCEQAPNLSCANGAQVATQDVSTIYNLKGTNSPLTFDGTTADANKITLSLTADPAGSFTFSIPAGAASAAAQAVSCSAGNHVATFSATTGAFTCTADTSTAVRWDQITNPTTNLALSMGANTTAFTWGTATGAGTNMFTIADTASNSGTGYLLSLNTASSSAAKPLRVTAGGTANGVEMTTAGLLQAIGTGGIKATTTSTGALSNALTWNESCTASPCTLAAAPRTADTALVVWRTVVQRRVASCGGINEYTLASTTLTLCDSTGVGAAPDNFLVTYEL